MYETVKKEITRTASDIKKAAEEEITVSRKYISLKVTAAFLGGIVLGMLISPRKKVSYKIASENHDIGGGEVSLNGPHKCCDDEYEDEYYDDDDNDDDEKSCCKKNGKVLKF